MQGKVKWFDEEKGFGFICQEDGTEVFVHYSHILQEGYKTLIAGDDVEFEVVTEEKGPQARNVERL